MTCSNGRSSIARSAGSTRCSCHGLPQTSSVLSGAVSGATDGQVHFHARVAANVLRIVTRQLRAGPGPEARTRQGLGALGVASLAGLSAAIRRGEFDGREAELFPFLWSTVADRLAVANPRHGGEG